MEEIIQNLTLGRATEVTVTQPLEKGRYAFVINAPFNTDISVSLVSHQSGVEFFDRDPNAHTYNAELKLQQSGQYKFRVRLSRPVPSGQLDIMFNPLSVGGDSGGSSDGGGGSSIPSHPAEPTHGWAFVYELTTQSGKTEVYVHQTSAGLSMTRRSPNGQAETYRKFDVIAQVANQLVVYSSEIASSNGLGKQEIRRDWNWTWLSMGVAKFKLVKKIKV